MPPKVKKQKVEEKQPEYEEKNENEEKIENEELVEYPRGLLEFHRSENRPDEEKIITAVTLKHRSLNGEPTNFKVMYEVVKSFGGISALNNRATNETTWTRAVQAYCTACKISEPSKGMGSTFKTQYMSIVHEYAIHRERTEQEQEEQSQQLFDEKQDVEEDEENEAYLMGENAMSYEERAENSLSDVQAGLTRIPNLGALNNSHKNRLQRSISSSQNRLSQIDQNPQKTFILGKSRQGKTFTIDQALQVSEISSIRYENDNENNSTDLPTMIVDILKTSKGTKEEKEARGQELLAQIEPNDDVFDENGFLKNLQKVRAETENLAKRTKYCISGHEHDVPEPFLIQHEDKGVSATKTNDYIAKGTRYQGLCVTMSTEEIQQVLGNFDFAKKMKILESGKLVEAEKKKLQMEYDHMVIFAKFLADYQEPSLPENAENGGEISFDDIKLEEKDFPLPTSPDTVVIADSRKDIVGIYKMFDSKGKHKLSDRVYVRDEMDKFLTKYPLLVKESRYYAPCIVLENTILINGPGTDCNSSELRVLLEAIDAADRIVVLTTVESIVNTQHVKECFEKYVMD